MFSKYLLLTNTVVSVALDGAGDFLQQRLFERTPDHDWERTGRMATIGLVLAPPDHYYYLWLDRRYPGKDPKTLAKKLLLDELTIGIWDNVIFFGGINIHNSPVIGSLSAERASSDPFVRHFL